MPGRAREEGEAPMQLPLASDAAAPGLLLPIQAFSELLHKRPGQMPRAANALAWNTAAAVLAHHLQTLPSRAAATAACHAHAHTL